LLTTHQAERLCDRVAIIDGGKIIELGTPREIQQRVLGQSLVEVTTNETMPIEQLPDGLRELRHTTRDEGRTLSIQTDSPPAVIVELVKWIDRHGLTLTDIHLKRPTLEDVFIELTGR
jgi:ABC-2 type transport system ATP-binding protein